VPHVRGVAWTSSIGRVASWNTYWLELFERIDLQSTQTARAHHDQVEQ